MISEADKNLLIKYYEQKLFELEELTKLLHEYSLTKRQFSQEELMLLSESDRDKIRFDPNLNLNRFKIEMKEWLNGLKVIVE